MMSDKYALLLINRQPATFSLPTILESVGSVGLSLTYPGTDSVKVLKKMGEEGNRAKKEFYDLLRTSDSISFQWWWNQEEDVYCSISFRPDVVQVLFGLDGLDQRQENSLIDCLKHVCQEL